LSARKEATRARALLSELGPILLAANPWDHMLSAAMAYCTAAIGELGDKEFAARLLPAAQAIVAAGVPDWYMTSNHLTLARLAAMLDDLQMADQALSAARGHLEGRQLPMRAIVDFEQAVVRRSLRSSGFRELADRAREQFAALGMTVWLERAGDEFRSAELTKREAEILRLLTRGLTNRQIAEQLVLSVHTVERHLNNIYPKIGARNRADAAAYAVRHGL
jgi:DNA-binding CsgD family transcriptional regulator